MGLVDWICRVAYETIYSSLNSLNNIFQVNNYAMRFIVFVGRVVKCVCWKSCVDS